MVPDDRKRCAIMTPMNNAEYLTRLKYADEFEKLRVTKKEKGFTFKELAEKLGVSKMWIASVFDGQQYVPKEYAKKLAALLDLPADSLAFRECKMKCVSYR